MFDTRVQTFSTHQPNLLIDLFNSFSCSFFTHSDNQKINTHEKDPMGLNYRMIYLQN